MPGLRRWKVICLFGHFAVLAGCFCLAQTPDGPSATVEGTVAIKGLPDVTVRLERVPTNPLSDFDGYLATVEADGRFSFEDVAPGDYRLTALSSSQMRGELGSPKPGIPGTILELKAGDHRKDLALNLLPDPVGFCGRVVDADGKPLRADVEVYAPQFTGDGAKLHPIANPLVLTDPNGYFMLAGAELAFLPIPQLNQHFSRLFLRANGVWYPSTENFADAVAVPARPISQSGCNVVIQIPRTRCTGHRVIGKVQGMPAEDQSGYAISLYEVNPANVLFQKDSQPSIYNTDHVEFENVCDGSYAILTWPDKPLSPHDRPGYYASSLFHVDGKDTDVTIAGMDQEEVWKLTHQQDIWTRTTPNLPPQEPASIHGSLELVDGLTWKQACPVGISQQLRLERGKSYEESAKRENQNPIYATLDKQGHFSFDKLVPGAYSLNLGSFAHGAAYVKSIQLNGQPLPALQFTLAEGKSVELNVELSNDPAGAAGKPRADSMEPHYLPPGTHPAASVGGRVTGPDAAGAKLKLTLLAAGSPSNFGAEAIETTAANDGSFRIDGVAPGIYRLSTEGEHHQYSEHGANGPGLEGLAVVLNAGQQRQGLDVKTYAKTSLCGTVFGSDGRPRPGIAVEIRGYTGVPNANGSPGNWTKQAVTDAHGKYTIAEAGPGYRELWAQDGNTITYFPSDRSHGMADATPEQQGCVFNIYLRSADDGSTLAHTLSGTVDGRFDASLGDRFYVELEPANREFTPVVERVQMKEPGSFTLKNVWPGKYTISLYGEYGKGTIPCPMPSSICFGYFHHPLSSQQIAVTNRNVEGFHLSVGLPPTLDGEFVVDGKLPQGWDSPAVRLFWNTSNTVAKADAKGHFSFPPLDAFEYRFSTSAFPLDGFGPVYVESATLDGKPLTGQHFELHIGQKAHLVIHLKVGSSSGTIKIGPGGPLVDPYRDLCKSLSSGGSSTVVLMIPDPLPPDDSGIVADSLSAHGNGAVSAYFSAVRPGKYHAVAVDNVGIPSAHTWAQSRAAMSHDFLVRLAALGKPLEVVAGQEFESTAPLLTEQAQRLMAEMGLTATH
jgi:protocatechuate 3,4-dioxygenase beta subunit